MACLPISPPGQHSLLEIGEIRLPVPGFAVSSAINTRHLLGLSRRGRGFLNHWNPGLASHFGTLLGKNRQRKTCHKEDNRHQGGHPGQEATATLTTKYCLRCTATKGCASISTLALLNQDNTYQCHGDHDVNNDYQRSEEHTSELQSRPHLVCRLLLEKKKKCLVVRPQ